MQNLCLKNQLILPIMLLVFQSVKKKYENLVCEFGLSIFVAQIRLCDNFYALIFEKLKNIAYSYGEVDKEKVEDSQSDNEMIVEESNEEDKEEYDPDMSLQNGGKN